MMDTKPLTMRICLSLLLISILSTAAAQQIEYTISGKFTNWPKQRSIAIIYTANNEMVMDTIIAVNGKFTYKGKHDEPLELSLSYDPPAKGNIKDNTHIYVSQGKIQLSDSDSLKNAKIKGPKETMDFAQFQAEILPFKKRMLQLRLRAMQIQTAKGDPEAIASLEKVFRATIDTLRSAYQDFIVAHPASHSSLAAIKNLDGQRFSDPKILALYEGLHASVKESPTGKIIQKGYEIGMKTSMGTILEDFNSLDTARQPLSLAEVKAKGKLTLVDFWASWCKPCREENPHLRKVYTEFHDKGLNIIAVSLDRTVGSWKNAINQDQLPWYHVSGLQYWDEPIVKQFGIVGVPDSFLLDQDGRIIGRGLRGEKLYETIKKQLEK